MSITPWTSSLKSVVCRLASPMREKSSSFSVISLQRKASFWIIRR